VPKAQWRVRTYSVTSTDILPAGKGVDPLDRGLLIGDVLLPISEVRRRRPFALALSGAHHILHLRRVHELLEARQFSVANLEYVADLSVETLACGLEGP
jgi:hypothetical protein